MEANGLLMNSSNMSSVSLLGCGVFGHPSTTSATTTTTTPSSKVVVDELMTDVVMVLTASTPDRAGVVLHNAPSTDAKTTAAPIAAAVITPSASRNNSVHRHRGGNDDDEFSKILKGVGDNVALARARIKDIEDRIARTNHTQQQQQQQTQTQNQQSESSAMLKDQLLAETVCLIDALVIMGWEHYRCYLNESSSYETAEAASKHIFEQALDVSIRLFCSDPLSSSSCPAIAMNMDRLMILLLVLDFDEYCETLLQYQLAREYMAANPLVVGNPQGGSEETSGVLATFQRMKAILRPTGPNYLRQLHELWKSGAFDRFEHSSATSEDEEGFAKVHAAGLCLVLFRKLESGVDRQQTTDLTLMEEQFKILFDDYLPKQLTQKPSMNNIVATKYSRLLFLDDGTPTVYWSLLADSYRREWGDYFDRENNRGIEYDDENEFENDESTDMDTDEDEDDDDGL